MERKFEGRRWEGIIGTCGTTIERVVGVEIMITMSIDCRGGSNKQIKNAILYRCKVYLREGKTSGESVGFLSDRSDKICTKPDPH